MKTRSKPKAVEAALPASTRAKALSPTDSNPPKVIILPKDASQEARFVTLPDPASSKPGRYFFCPKLGLHEMKIITASPASPRSCLISGLEERETNTHNVGDAPLLEQGYLVKKPDLLMATPIDAIFFMLSILVPRSESAPKKQMFLDLDDYLDSLTLLTPSGRHCLSSPDARTMLENRLRAICDVVDTGDQKMYRISDSKLAAELFAKASRVCQKGLPNSMEERFVKDALRGTIYSNSLGTSVGTCEVDVVQPVVNPSSDKDDSQRSNESSISSSTSVDSQSTTSTAPTSVSGSLDEAGQSLSNDLSSKIRNLLRLKTALNFLLASYVPEHIHTRIYTNITASELVDFTPLDEHLARLATARQQVQALRAVSDNISRKRTAADDEEMAARAEKKQKKEEEEKRKKSESRALKDLKKVDTGGMKKLSAFFTKMPAK